MKQSEASKAGYKAAMNGKPYSSNPYARDAVEHLQWSKAHNAARVDIILGV